MRFCEIEENKDPNRPLDFHTGLIIGSSHKTIYEWYDHMVDKIRFETDFERKKLLKKNIIHDLEVLVVNELLSEKTSKRFSKIIDKK